MFTRRRGMFIFLSVMMGATAVWCSIRAVNAFKVFLDACRSGEGLDIFDACLFLILFAGGAVMSIIASISLAKDARNPERKRDR
jgi:hypothetical protein